MTKRVCFDEANPGYQKLIKGLKQADDDYMESFGLASMPSVEFSKKYDKNMERLIKNQKQSCWKFVNSAGKKAAVFVLVLFLAFSVGSITAEALGLPVFEFVENAYEKFTDIFVNKNEISDYPTTIEEVYTLTGLPEGFVEDKYEADEFSVNTVWKNGSARIELSQHTLGGKISFDTEHSEYIKIVHNDMEVIYICNYSGITIVYFYNGKYQFSIYSSAEKTPDEMIALIDSLNIKAE